MRSARVAAALAVATSGAAGVAPAAATAASSGGVRQVVTAAFTTVRPHALTGVTVTAVYSDGAAPAGPPYALRHVVDGLPPGTTVDTRGVPQCHASDAAFSLRGAASCPAASIVGSGHVLLDLGLGALGALKTEVTLVNAGSEVLFVGREPRTGISLVDHGMLRGSAIDIEIPQVPGLGAEGATVLREDFTITRASRLLRTPQACPAATRRWVFRRAHTYGDGVTQTARVALPCRRPRR